MNSLTSNPIYTRSFQPSDQHAWVIPLKRSHDRGGHKVILSPERKERRGACVSNWIYGCSEQSISINRGRKSVKKCLLDISNVYESKKGWSPDKTGFIVEVSKMLWEFKPWRTSRSWAWGESRYVNTDGK